MNTHDTQKEIITRRISDNAAISEPTGVIYPDRLWKERMQSAEYWQVIYRTT